MNEKERAVELINDHWKYIEELLSTHDVDEVDIAYVEFHYKSSGFHFYGHALEDERSGMFKGEKDE